MYDNLQYVTVSVKTRLICTSMSIEKIEILHKITHATRKNMHVFIEPVLKEGRFKSIKLYTILLMGILKIFVSFL